MTSATDPLGNPGGLGDITSTLEALATSSDKAGASLGKALTGASTSGKSLDQTLQGVLGTLSKMAGANLGTLTQGLSATVSSLLSSSLGMAGGAAASVPVTPFAAGGVVAQPTFFGGNGGLGLMGEHGAEAILPLARGPGGELGVIAREQASAAPVTINIATPDPAAFRQSQVQLTSALARAVARGQRGL